MIPDSVGPLSRPFPLRRVTPAGIDATVEANGEERAALAADLQLPAIHALTGAFRITGSAAGIRVAGRVAAEIEQTCVVTLEPFPTRVEEDVEVEFRAPDGRRPARDIDLDPQADEADELVGDQVDLGAITAEFLALGLDPYPRKPGATFEAPDEGREGEGPFGRLAALRPRDDS